MPIPTELLAMITGRLTPTNGPASADDARRVWGVLFSKFNPLLGPLSTDLLFARSLAVQRAAFPWLPYPEPGDEHTGFTAFERCLDSCSPDDIAAVNHALLETYTSALADLIGEQLATRFLRTAFPGDDANKNTLEESA